MASRVQIGLSADDVKDALRKRHPAYEMEYAGIGRWTCLEEWHNIDLLALDAWSEGQVVGYEVKVSRSDMRSELLNPSKRAEAVAMCTRFYFAVPAGLLKPEEREFVEPEWEPSDFVRPRCTNDACSAKGRLNDRGFMRHYPKARGSSLRGKDIEGVTVFIGYHTDSGTKEDGSTYSYQAIINACCMVCKGYGTTAKSRVELEAPMLWIPKDVGLIVVGPGGCSVLREAPQRKVTEPIIKWPYRNGPSRLSPEDASRLNRSAISQLVRWTSARPDPRHALRGRNIS